MGQAVRTAACAAAALALTFTGGVSRGQDRGRTDGPENSEWGKGGYEGPDDGLFSLSLVWGGAVNDREGRDDGPPIFAGLKAMLWYDDWFQVEGQGHYVARTKDVNFLIGPRFRTGALPLGVHLGLLAGGIVVHEEGLRFGISPQGGLDLTLYDHYLLDLEYALDVPLGVDSLTHRVFLSVGYRF